MLSFIELTDNGKCLRSVNNKAIIEFVVPSGVERILIHAFHKCVHLQKLVISRTVKIIDYGAFAYCTSLEIIEIQDGNDCYIWENEALYDYDKTTLFKVSVNAKRLKIPNTVENICDYAFQGNRCTEEIKIPNSVKSIGFGVFSDCTALRRLFIPNSIKSIGVIGKASHLKDIEIEDNSEFVADNGIIYTKDLSELVRIYNYENTELIIPATVKKIRSFAISEQKRLNKIEMCNGLKSIGFGAFSLCINLESIIIPSSVDTINPYAFNHCEKLSEIYCYIKEPNNITVEISSFDVFDNFFNATLFVSKESLKKYTKHPIFGQFKKISVLL